MIYSRTPRFASSERPDRVRPFLFHPYKKQSYMMEVERINQIQNLTDDLTRRLTELRGYL